MLVAGYNGTNSVFAFVDKDGASGTTDYWTSTGTDGEAIACSFRTGAFYMDSPTLDKLFQSIILELDAPAPTTTSNYITVNVYYDYAASPADIFTIPDNTTAGASGSA